MAALGVRPGARVAAAVSGGADSMALAHLLAGWARDRDAHVHALTVDHGLRDEAAHEAARVAAWCAPLGLPHLTLRWDEGGAHRARAASAQAAARAARYRLMTRWCRDAGCSHLFLAHHADDQAETFLLRLARGSGVAGLAAMAPLAARDGVMLARPLLAMPKARLAAYCREIGQDWISDPSNDDALYGRVRFRNARGMLAREGLTTARLLATAGHMRRARAALDHYVGELLDRACAWDAFGVGRIALDDLRRAPEEVGLRALAAVLAAASGQVYPPRFERLLRLYESLRAGPWRDATLHGCLIARAGAVLTVTREAALIADACAVTPGRPVTWDGRFRVCWETPAACAAPGGGEGFQVKVFRAAPRDGGPEGAALARALAPIPPAVRETLPALFDSAGLAAFPHATYVRGDLAATPGLKMTATYICPRIDQISGDDADM